MGRSKPSTPILLGSFLIALPALACSMVFRTVTVGSNFNVRVSGSTGSVQGLVVELSTGGAIELRAVTNKDGLAEFRRVRPGSYFLSTGRDAGMGDGAELDVRDAQPGEITVPLTWPNAKVLTVASLKGILHLPERIPGRPQPSIPLELLKGVPGQLVGNTNTDENGAFAFSDVAPGFYFLKVRLYPDNSGLIAVAVEPRAPTDALDLDVGWTSCGLYYAAGCPQTNLHLESLEGRIVDAAKASIPGAEILLLDHEGKLVEQAQSDSTGKFAPIRMPAGTYQLLVRNAGFIPLRGTLTFESHGASSPIEVELGIGSCSRTNVQ